MSKLIFVLGGTRSGKSSFAEELAASYRGPVVYLATAAVLDDEMAKRVQLHKESRPAHWETIEETHNLAAVVEKAGLAASVILVDCLSILVSNLLLDDNFGPADFAGKEQAIMTQIDNFCQVSAKVSATVIAVSNEVGSGLVPTYQLGRAYRDILGRVNQLVARHASNVYYTVAGLPLDIKEIGRQTRANIFGEWQPL